jgi:hypothetical protein
VSPYLSSGGKSLLDGIDGHNNILSEAAEVVPRRHDLYDICQQPTLHSLLHYMISPPHY